MNTGSEKIQSQDNGNVSKTLAAGSIAPHTPWKKPDYLVMAYSTQGELTYVNETYCDYFQMEKKALLGKNFIHLVPREDVMHVSQSVSKLSPANPACSIAHDVQHDGDGLRRQLWVHHAFFTPEGDTAAYLAVGIDVTARSHDPEYIDTMVRDLSHVLKTMRKELHNQTM